MTKRILLIGSFLLLAGVYSCCLAQEGDAPIRAKIESREECIRNFSLNHMRKGSIAQFSLELAEYFFARALVNNDPRECDFLNEYWSGKCRVGVTKFVFWTKLALGFPADMQMIDECRNIFGLDSQKCVGFIESFKGKDFSAICKGDKGCIGMREFDPDSYQSQMDKDFMRIIRAFRDSNIELCRSVFKPTGWPYSQRFCEAYVSKDINKCAAVVSATDIEKIKTRYCAGCPTEKEIQDMMNKTKSGAVAIEAAEKEE